MPKNKRKINKANKGKRPAAGAQNRKRIKTPR
jgi:hypothetical protein